MMAGNGMMALQPGMNGQMQVGKIGSRGITLEYSTMNVECCLVVTVGKISFEITRLNVTLNDMQTSYHRSYDHVVIPSSGVVYYSMASRICGEKI